MANESLQTCDRDNTRNLLRDILQELKSIGGQLKRQDERLTAVENRISDRPRTGSRDDGLNTGRIEGSATTPWTPILAEIQSAGATRLTVAEAVQIYINDFVGIDQLVREDSSMTDVAIHDVSLEQQEAWTTLIGHLWRVPEDGRLSLRFQKRWLLRPTRSVTRLPTDPWVARVYLQKMLEDEQRIPIRPHAGELERSNISISDYFDGEEDLDVHYDMEPGTMEPFHDPLDGHEGGLAAKGPKMCTSGPWRRIICLRGLECRTISIFQDRWGPVHIHKAIEDYMLCRRRHREKRWVEWESGAVRFHVTYYHIQTPFQRRGQSFSPWKSGRLHSVKNDRNLSESAYTALLIPGFERSRTHWTLLELRAPDLSSPADGVDSVFNSKTDVLLAALLVTDRAMISISAYWREICEYFDHLVSEKDTFLDPERHDDLLSDDETFSRSKMYFWAITTLKELDLSITDNLLQIQRLLDSRAPDFVEKQLKADFEDARSCLRIRYRDIEEIAIKFREKRQEAVDLRDGLFSASAVIESRASTRLGENVKLLTFVSIFFLPLSFCMSIWSINTLLSLTALGIVAPIMAIFTYVTVFNIDNIVRTCRDIRAFLVSQVVRSMKNDQSEVWSERGNAFERFSMPRRAEERPSDWRLLQYVVIRMLWPPRFASKTTSDCQ